jgi:hypothetical protein
MRGGAAETTGQIQNAQVFLEGWNAGVSPTTCFISGRDFGARVQGAYSGGKDFARGWTQAV